MKQMQRWHAATRCGWCAVFPSRAVALTVVLGLAVAPAMASTRTPRTHHVPVAQVQAPESHGTAKPGAKAKPAKPGAAASKKRGEPATAKPNAHNKSRKRHPEDDADDDPVVMYRAHGGHARRGEEAPQAARHRPEAEPRRHRAVPEAPVVEAKNLPLARRFRVRQAAAAAAASQASEAAISDAAPAPKKTLTVDDFMRAAGAPDLAATTAPPAPPAETFERGEAHPEDDERFPVHPVAVNHPAGAKPQAARALAHTAAAPAQAMAETDEQPAAPIVRRHAAQRVDGFGAEGAVLSSSPDDLQGSPFPKPSAIAKAPPTRDPALAALAHPSKQELAQEAVLPEVRETYTRNGHLVVPAALKGSHDVLVHQNTMADDEGLDRIQDDDDLNSMRAHHLLVDFPESASLHVNPDLPYNRRCARPWTVRFATDIARAYSKRFGQALQVNSAVRTVAYQVRLQRVNGNAAAVDGEGASPHLTGQAIDFGKRGMTVAQIAWMRSYLLPLMQAGKIDVEEEFQQACFHISAYRSYLPAEKKHAPVKTEVAQLRGEPHMLRTVKTEAVSNDESDLK